MAQLVARLSGGQEAVSSSLATPTRTKQKGNPIVVAFLFVSHPAKRGVKPRRAAVSDAIDRKAVTIAIPLQTMFAPYKSRYSDHVAARRRRKRLTKHCQPFSFTPAAPFSQKIFAVQIFFANIIVLFSSFACYIFRFL